MRPVVLAAALVTLPAAAFGQTQDLIDRGIAAYEAFQVEAARPLFKQIVSPSYVYPVSSEQRVTAYKYLGASYAVLSIPDTAEQFFTAALLFDPFTDLDPAKFSESELGPFRLAKSKIFKIGLRTIESQVVDPRDSTTAYRFVLVTTHRASLTVELVSQKDSSVENILQGERDGLNEIRWEGLLRSRGRIADSTTYILRVRARSALNPAAPEATEAQFFRVEHAYPPLEDTLPPLPASMRLKDTIPRSAPWLDLTKGALVGIAAGALPLVAMRNTDLKWQTQAAIAVAVSFGSGAASFLYRQQKSAIPENVAENARRERQRANFNAGVVARNREKTAQTRLIITPLAGAGAR